MESQQKAQPKPKSYKLTDSGGLCLFVSAKGCKSWRFNYRFNGKRQTLTIGKYPDVSVDDARSKHAEAKKVLAQGTNPACVKREEKEALRNAVSGHGQWPASRHRGVQDHEGTVR